MNENTSNECNINYFNESYKNSYIRDIFVNFIQYNPEKRPNIYEIINTFYDEYQSQIQLNDFNEIYKEFDILINDPQKQLHLGNIYYKGELKKRNINKAIHFYSLAANQNEKEAQFNLGIIFLKGEYIRQNINKAIKYFVLAANQNDQESQFVLGALYFKGKHVSKDIEKAIDYLSLAAN